MNKHNSKMFGLCNLKMKLSFFFFFEVEEYIKNENLMRRKKQGYRLRHVNF